MHADVRDYFEVPMIPRLRIFARLLLRTWPRVISKTCKNAWHARRNGSKIHPTCTLAKRAEVLNSELEFMVKVAHHGSVRRSKLGRYSGLGRYTKIADAEIGAFCSISWDCTVGAHNHPLDRLTTHEFPFTARFEGLTEGRHVNRWRANTASVALGNDVWVGANSVIVDGVRIGDGSIVGAGSVVTKNVEPYSVVAGVPARVLRKRFSPEICDGLLRIRWWEWPDDVLRQHLALFHTTMTTEILGQLEQVCASLRTH